MRETDATGYAREPVTLAESVDHRLIRPPRLPLAAIKGRCAHGHPRRNLLAVGGATGRVGRTPVPAATTTTWVRGSVPVLSAHIVSDRKIVRENDDIKERECVCVTERESDRESEGNVLRVRPERDNRVRTPTEVRIRAPRKRHPHPCSSSSNHSTTSRVLQHSGWANPPQCLWLGGSWLGPSRWPH